MKKENFSIQGSLDGNYLNIALEDSINFDEIAIKVMEQDCPEFFLPFKIVDINDSISLRYKLVNNIALEYADTSMNKKTFIKMFSGLVKPFIECKDWMLNYRNICISPEYVFLDTSKGMVHYVYIPEHSFSNNDDEILSFLKDAFTKRNITDDPAFQVKMFQFFMRNDVTLLELYNLLKEEGMNNVASAPLQRTVATAQVASTAPVSAPIQSAPSIPLPVAKTAEPTPSVKKESVFAKKPELGGNKAKAKPEKSKDNSANDLFGDLSSDNLFESSSDDIFGDMFNDNKAKKDSNSKNNSQKPEKKAGAFAGLFGGKKKEAPLSQPVVSQPVQQPVQQATPVMQQAPQISSMPMMQPMSMPMGDDGVTEILAPSTSASMRKHLELMDSPIPGAIPMIDLEFSKDYITVGRISSDENKPDVAFNSDFKKISRKHLRIEKRNGMYYVIDLGSPNKTLLDNNILVPNNPYELRNGQILTFTDAMPVRYRVNI